MTNVTCIFCNVNLVVHAAASMIICPDCEMIAPLGVDNKDGEASLGLGLRRESLELSSSHFEDGNGLVAENVVEELKTCNLNRDPDEDSLSLEALAMSSMHNLHRGCITNGWFACSPGC